MRKFYLISTIVVGVLILIMSFAQLGSTCSLLLLPETPVFLVFLQMAGIGAIFGGLAILFWKMPPPEVDDSDEGELAAPQDKLSTKIEE